MVVRRVVVDPGALLIGLAIYEGVFHSRRDKSMRLSLDGRRLEVADPARDSAHTCNLGDVTVANLYVQRTSGGPAPWSCSPANEGPQIGIEFALRAPPTAPHAIDIDAADRRLGGQATCCAR